MQKENNVVDKLKKELRLAEIINRAKKQGGKNGKNIYSKTY